jgi:leucine-rich repeat protein SHOC2
VTEEELEQKIETARLNEPERLYLGQEGLASLPESIGNLLNLYWLDLPQNRLTTLPESIGNLDNLHRLYLCRNKLTTLPESIGNLRRLTMLRLYGNQLHCLPQSIGNLIDLYELMLDYNQLNSLPVSIGNFSKLTELSLNYNKLNSLPESIGNLSNLTRLFLSNNRLDSLPKSISKLSKLARINLDGNNNLNDLSILYSLPDLKDVIFLGVNLPRRYWTKLSDWNPKWLLDEENTEVRRVLIQQVGYDRICQELDAIELNTWREYTLLKIDADIDEEPMVLLKMTCPSTGHIHILRVPPEITSAEAAITWVNHGIHPDEFAVQT